MDLVIAVFLANCAIAMIVLVITFWTIRWRRQVIRLVNFWDRCLGDWDRLSIDPSRISDSTTRNQILQFRQIYQQQLVTLDRVRTLQSMWGMARRVINLINFRSG